MLLIQANSAAKALAVGVAVFAAAGEAAVTYAGSVAAQGPRRRRLATFAGSLAAVTLVRNRGAAATEDRRTREVIVVGTILAYLAEWTIAKEASGLRAGANSWPALVGGAGIAVLGVLLRLWGVRTLGRFFQRQVLVEPGQTIIRSGPYRWVRHPAYSGNLVTLFGVGVMLGSWVGAIVGFGIGLLAHLPRIYVEEAALGRAFGADYTRYATQTARLIPRLW